MLAAALREFNRWSRDLADHVTRSPGVFSLMEFKTAVSYSGKTPHTPSINKCQLFAKDASPPTNLERGFSPRDAQIRSCDSHREHRMSYQIAVEKVKVILCGGYSFYRQIKYQD